MVKRTWDNANIVESYPGVCAPLTFSFARFVYREVYSQTAEVFGYRHDFIRLKSRQMETFLGYQAGRFYYNLETWCDLAGYLPGFADNPAVLQEMMGVLPEDRINIQPKRQSKREKMKLLLSIISLYRRHDRSVNTWIKDFQSHRQIFQKDLDKAKNADEALDIYLRIESTFLLNWRVPIINDIFTMLFGGGLRKWSRRVLHEELDPKLLFSIGKSGNAQMVVSLRDIAESIKTKPEVKERFLSLPIDEKLSYLSEVKDIQVKVDNFYDNFGLRNGHDLKLETPNLKEDYSVLAGIIEEYLENENVKKSTSNNTHSAQETAVAKKLAKVGLINRIVGRWLMNQTRRAIKYREEMRMKRSQAFGLVRQVFLIIGQDLRKHNLINEVDDIFMLEVDEILNLIRGTNTLVNTKKLIACRRDEYNLNLKKTIPDHFQTQGIPNLSIPITQPRENKDKSLSGLGNYPAIIEGEVVIMDKPDLTAKVRGKIIVCPFTDPSWVPLMGLIKGIIVERGGLLSHAAIVSRELELPSILGVKDATQQLKNGWRIRLNSADGIITVLKKTNNG